MLKRISALFALLVIAVAFSNAGYAQDIETLRQEARKNQQNGNWKEAFSRFQKLCLDKENDGRAVRDDLNNAVQCLQRLGLLKDLDGLLEDTVAAHPDNWRLLQAAANQYLQNQHHGYMISGEFERGHHRGGGKVVSSLERDRMRALQLLQQAIPLVNQDDNKGEVADFYQQLAQQLLYNRGYHEAWRLQYLSNLDELPDYEDGWPYYRSGTAAPVGEDGQPVFHSVGKSWKEAKTDGERWRWCLEQVVENQPNRLNQVRRQFADFTWNQFGVQTMQWGGRFFGLPTVDEDNESGTYALHTLDEDESIARLAAGIKRFDIPAEFNFIKILQTIAAEPGLGGGENALNQLAQIFENRRQYEKAAEYWKQSIETYGPGPNGHKQQRLNQIVGNWGRFEGIAGVQPDGEQATVEFRFRNAEKVSFRAQEIKVKELLDDVKEYLKSNPGRIQPYWRINIGQLGMRLVHQNDVKYLGKQVAKWDMELKPRDHHFDRRVTVTTPLKKSGAYLVTADLGNGNTSQIIMWVADTAIVQKRLSGKNLYFVADAKSGKPVEGADLRFFGWRQQHIRGTNRYNVITKEFNDKTDDDGLLTPAAQDLQNNFQWLITSTTKGGRLAYLGFTNVWYNNYHDQEYNATRVFTITDRPVYRPDQKMHFKLWVRHSQYDKEDISQFADRSYPVEIRNPKGDVVFTEVMPTDEYGGIEGEWDIPVDATLGVYNVAIPGRKDGKWWIAGGNSFRVEEYKKPEYEVTIDAPSEPVMLGEKIEAKITAKYYFGSPVTNATVKYKIMRQDYSDNWYPIMPWDWCFGGGYWWFCYDYPWYPGWHNWVGCMRPYPIWYRGRHNPPELVAEREVEIGEDGTVKVEIDSQLAKELHGNKDHKYTITAEVRDQSRRTIVGTGNVLVARKPFKVFTWVDRGYYRVGDVVKANFKAQTLDKKPVKGKGVLTLLKITYTAMNQPIETPVRRWDIDTNVEGVANQQIRASAKGQYRLSYELTDSKDHKIEGGYLFTIIGDGFDGRDYRFNDIELIPDKREYAADEKLKLQINTERANSTVLLFVRPANGVYLQPRTIHMKGKSHVEEIALSKKDMPNFFVEAVTVSGGKVFEEAKEIVVPPEKRILNVDVLPSETAYKPGEKAKVKVHVTDFFGENFEGSIVATIYDKSVEYISGGSNVPDIKEFFWKWRRHHNPNHMSSLARYENNLTRPNDPGMSFLGVFGATVADEMEVMEGFAQGRGHGGDALAAQTKSVARAAAPGGNAGFGGGRKMAAQANGIALADAPANRAPGPPAEKRKANAGPGTGGGDQLVQPTVRSNFADTAKWVGVLKTDKTGIAEIELDMPENLTTWKIKVWGMGHGTKVGEGQVEVVTRKDLIIRLQAPRFFVQKDEVVLSANVHNYLKTDKEVTVALELDGGQLKPVDGTQATVKVKVPANGEKRIDWRVAVVDEGETTVRMKALTDEESDAMEMKFPCFIHGMLKTESFAGTVRPEEQSAKVNFSVPAERRVPQSVLEIRYSPTLAGAMVDALPYLADYPYGCTEQTLNRFLPSVVTQKVLLDMGLDLAAIKEKRTNLNAQEIGDDRERAKQWKRYKRNPVFDQAELDRMVKEGIKHLENMQCSDGGWGWFSGFGERSWPHTTAVVVHGLQIAQQNDVAIKKGVLDRGIAWLKRYQQQETIKIRNAPAKIRPWKPSADNLDAFVKMVLVDAGIDNEEMRGYLYRDRNNLSVYAKAMYGLALHKLIDTKMAKVGDELAMIQRNIEQFLVTDEENETAYLRINDGYWWYWYGSEIEADAYYLKLLAKTDPKGKTAPRLVKYLLNNRKHSTYWNSTRDTAACVEAFADFIRASGEDKPDMFVEVWLDGEKKKEVEINASNFFSYDNKFVLVGDEVADGKHEVEIRRRGKGPVYFNAYLTNFTLEDHITKAGLEIKVERKYYKLNRVDKEIKVAGSRGQAVDQKVEKYERVELKNLSTLKSGDLVEIELSIESKNDYEYILFEDMKAAGFEPVEVRSGYTDNEMRAYTEFRDNRVAFFVRALARGNHSLSYRLRAEIPGKFSALPTRASAMYAPELKANSDEIKLVIED